jgi:regulator of sigma E protease
MITIIVFFLILGLLVLVHEFGHFIVAKKNGIRVEEFGFGIPPRIFGIKKGETLYSLNALPFGGFVKLYGEEELIIHAKAFSHKKPWQKATVILAGVVGNLLLGWILISYLFTQGVPVPTNKVVVEQVQKNSPAEQAGIKEKDVVIKIKKQQTAAPEKKIIVQKGENLWKIAEKEYGLGLKAFAIAKANKIKNPNIIYVGQKILLADVSFVQKEYMVYSSDDLITLTKQFAGEQIILVIKRDNKSMELPVISRKNPPKNQGSLGIVITSFIERRYPWYQAPFYGLIEAFSITKKIAVELSKMLLQVITFKTAKVDVTGPIGIARFTGQAIKLGNNAVLELIALLSLNLAVLNILPFPALDGGRLIFVAYEWITKKRVNYKIEQYVNMFGMVVLLSLALLISVHDILNIYK